MLGREVVLGPRSGSCGQWDIWEAVFGPRGADGYPARVWCKDPTKGCEYGAINTTVAHYWRDHFDLLGVLRREWRAGLGAKLAGKLHVFVGGGDSFFLTNAVMDFQDWVTSPEVQPPFDGEIVVGTHGGRGYEHCFNGYLPDGTVAPNGLRASSTCRSFCRGWRREAAIGAARREHGVARVLVENPPLPNQLPLQRSIPRSWTAPIHIALLDLAATEHALNSEPVLSM